MLQEIDKDGNHTLSKEELAQWLVKHADELNIQGHNLGTDLKAFAAAAMPASKPFKFADYANPDGSINQEKMQARDKGEKAKALLDDEITAIIIEIKEAIDASHPSRADQVRNAPRQKSAEEIEEEKEDLEDQEAAFKRWYKLKKVAGYKGTKEEAETEWRKMTGYGVDEEDGEKPASEMKLSPQQQKAADEARAVLAQYASGDVKVPGFADLAPLLTNQTAPAKEGNSR